MSFFRDLLRWQWSALVVDPAQIIAARDRILAGAEFRMEEDWTTRLEDWARNWLRHLEGLLPASLRLVLAILAILLIVGVVLWLVPRQRGLGQTEGQRRAPVAAASPLDFVQLQAAARRAQQAGRLEETIRLAWLAALALLMTRGLTSRQGARADWEHVQIVRGQRNDVATPLADLASEFQRTRFGAASALPPQADRCLALLAQIESTLAG